MKGIILFDGVCHFCNRSVNFIIKRDPNGIFNFASLQSETGQRLLTQLGVKEDLDSIILIVGKEYYVKSTAAIYICKSLSGLWKLFAALKMIPKPIRDYLYDWIARNRYKWFGKQESCMIPSPEIRSRFLK